MGLRQTEGSTLCPACGKLVGVGDESCWSCGRARPGMWGLAPALRRFGADLGFLPLVLGGCSALYLATLFAVSFPSAENGLGRMLSPSVQGLYLFGASGARPVFGDGRWWTVLTASWLHGGPLHILFNLMWLRNLVPPVSELFGPARMVIIYVAAGATGFIASSFAGWYLHFLPLGFQGATITVGASAAIFGLLAALFYYGRRTGSSAIGNQAKIWALVLLAFGLVMPQVDNWAHVGGWVGGYLAARSLDPLKPERLDHLVAALTLLVGTGAALVASVWTARSLLP